MPINPPDADARIHRFGIPLSIQSVVYQGCDTGHISSDSIFDFVLINVNKAFISNLGIMSGSYLVIPGQIITESGTGGGDTEDSGFLRGHGTYIEGLETGLRDDMDAGDAIEMDYDNSNKGDENDDMEEDEDEVTPVVQRPQRLVASVAGVVERVNKLISVVPASPTAYVPAIGDLIVGRIASVGSNRWKVTINPYQREAALLLSGVNLPNGTQRIRTSEDALAMRQLFSEGDLVSAEVQQVTQDGTASLHTRSLRYGKLENGCLIQVPASLIPRMKQHFATLILSGSKIIEVLLGKNGNIWIQRAIPKEWGLVNDRQDVPLAETLQKTRKMHAETPVLPKDRLAICRVRNSIEALRLVHCRITPENITSVYEKSLIDGIHPKQMLRANNIVHITSTTRKQ